MKPFAAGSHLIFWALVYTHVIITPKCFHFINVPLKESSSLGAVCSQEVSCKLYLYIGKAILIYNEHIMRYLVKVMITLRYTAAEMSCLHLFVYYCCKL